MGVRRQGINQVTLNRWLRDPRGGVARDMHRRGQRVLGVAKRRVGVDEGQLRADLHVEQLPIPLAPGVRVGSHLRRALPHHEGHGVIRPVHASVLVFRVRGQGWVFTQRVGPVPPNRYLTGALPAARG